MQRARRYRRALESKRPKGNLSRPRPGPLQQRPRRTAGWACSLPCALRRLPTGVPGRKRWAMGTYGNHVWRRHVYKHWRAAAPADRPFARPTPLQTFCEARAGGNAPLGQNSSAPHAQPRVPGRPGLATGLTAGSSTHRVHAHSTFVIVCCCPPWSRLTRHCCWPSRAHKPPRGSRLYPRTGRPRCRGRSCRSLFDDASGCHHLWAPASAANMGAVRPLGRPRPRLHTQWPFGTPSEVGRASLARSMPRGGGSGGTRCPPAVAVAHVGARSPDVRPPTPRPRGLVVYGASPQRLALCCDATLVSPITGASTPHPRADHTAGIALRMAESRKRATYPELQRGGGQRLSSLLWRSEGAGTLTRRRLSDSSSGSGLSVRRRPSELPPPMPGRVGGGACCRLQCSTLLAARPWEHRGWSPKAPLGASLPWTTCWRSLSQLARAASRCACPSRWATPSSPDSAQPHVF